MTAASVVGAQLLHVAQPDAAQASALVVGAVPLLASRSVVKRGLGMPMAAIAVACCVVAWFRRDPVSPVEHVERVLYMTADDGTASSFAAIVAGAMLFVPFFVDGRVRRFGIASVLFLAAMFVSTFFGNFPVPVFGAGVAPILGWYGLVVLCLADRSRCARTSERAGKRRRIGAPFGRDRKTSPWRAR
jgi:hypothetical protein